MSKDIRDEISSAILETLSDEEMDNLVALFDSQKEELVEVLKSEEFTQRCEWRYWYKKENNPDTSFAAGYERALNDIINQLESK